MTKQQILEEVARRVGDTDAGFINEILAPIFDLTLSELAQLDCLPMLQRRSQFPLNTPSGSVDQNILIVNTEGALGSLPIRVNNNLLVPAWGPSAGYVMRVNDTDFDVAWLANSTQPGRPVRWRPYPTIAELQLHPAPNADNLTASVTIDWIASPQILAAGDTIVDVQLEDLPTLVSGCYRHGILFRDDTFSDMQKAQAEWMMGVTRMKERKLAAEFYGRRVQLRYREF